VVFASPGSVWRCLQRPAGPLRRPGLRPAHLVPPLALTAATLPAGGGLWLISPAKLVQVLDPCGCCFRNFEAFRAQPTATRCAPPQTVNLLPNGGPEAQLSLEPRRLPGVPAALPCAVCSQVIRQACARWKQ